jgi:hypothetical protein
MIPWRLGSGWPIKWNLLPLLESEERERAGSDYPPPHHFLSPHFITLNYYCLFPRPDTRRTHPKPHSTPRSTVSNLGILSFPSTLHQQQCNGERRRKERKTPRENSNSLIVVEKRKGKLSTQPFPMPEF